jgi:hypothetical protein
VCHQTPAATNGSIATTFLFVCREFSPSPRIWLSPSAFHFLYIVVTVDVVANLLLTLGFFLLGNVLLAKTQNPALWQAFTFPQQGFPKIGH